MDDKLKKTMGSMIIGTSIYSIILLILSLIFFLFYYKNSPDKTTLIIKNEICLIIGYIISIVGIYSMARSIMRVTLNDDASYAKKYMTLMASTRFIIFLIILIILVKVFGFIGAFMYILTTLGIKAGAYSAPFIEKKIYKES